ncbi:hypothetical protein BQ8794_180007 [Mesorhizobium prunaredense]|uniref:Uncharacterized protein n=1 Tax=Mesorhizobium prunaredense TaxID=1631249 RepID=A0A1R3V416_9HYPH|nr:hypothetical protein BQ8794_180007 [Mesorhizobium prunaredense]
MDLTSHGNRCTRERVTAHRSHHKIPVFRPAADGKEPWLNLDKAAGLLGVAPKPLRLATETGEIKGSMGLQPINAQRTGDSAHRTSRVARPQIPHGIASRSAKTSHINDINRWVL